MITPFTLFPIHTIVSLFLSKPIGIQSLSQQLLEGIQCQAKIIEDLRQIGGDMNKGQENVLQSFWGLIAVIKVIIKQFEFNHEPFNELKESYL